MGGRGLLGPGLVSTRGKGLSPWERTGLGLPPLSAATRIPSSENRVVCLLKTLLWLPVPADAAQTPQCGRECQQKLRPSLPPSAASALPPCPHSSHPEEFLLAPLPLISGSRHRLFPLPGPLSPSSSHPNLAPLGLPYLPRHQPDLSFQKASGCNHLLGTRVLPDCESESRHACVLSYFFNTQCSSRYI